LGLAIIPGGVFFSLRGGVSLFLGSLNGQDLKVTSAAIFPLVGLYAFFFIWAQLMIGGLMPWLRRVYPYRRLLLFHQTEGLFAFLLALTHPILLAIGYGLNNVLFERTFVAPQLAFWVFVGYFNFLLIILTGSAAVLRKTSWLRYWWRYIHWGNYVLFWTVWLHAWFLGSDVHSSSLRYIWIGAAITAIIATSVRWRARFVQNTNQAPPVIGKTTK
jgi:hypothetical protein